MRRKIIRGILFHQMTADPKKNPKTTPENNTGEKGNIHTKNKKNSDEECLTRDTENTMSLHSNKNHGINENTNVQNDSDGKNGTQTLNFILLQKLL